MLPIPFLLSSLSTSAAGGWQSSWGPEPPFWYDASTGNLTTNRGGSGSSYNLSGTTVNYGNTKNGLTVADMNGFLSVGNIYAFNSTHFFVFRYVNTSIFSVDYTANANQTGPGGGGNYNAGKFYFEARLSNRPYSDTVWSYTGTYPSETYPHVKSTHTSMTHSTWYVMSATSDKDSGSNMTVWVNSTTQSNTTFTDSSYGSVLDDTLEIYSGTGNFLAEYIQYNSILSRADVILVENYLKNKWGI